MRGRETYTRGEQAYDGADDKDEQRDDDDESATVLVAQWSEEDLSRCESEHAGRETELDAGVIGGEI